MKTYKKIVFCLSVLSLQISNAQIINTYAGTGTAGYSGDNGLATSAELWSSSGVAVDKLGNVYIADEPNQRIRKVNSLGIITTVAGNGTSGFSGDNGFAISAEISNPRNIAVDDSGNIYIADYSNSRVRKVNTQGIITTIAGNGTVGNSGDNGPAIAAQLNSPRGVAVDKHGNIYVVDLLSNVVRKINTFGIITTVAGTGVAGYSGNAGLATLATLDHPEDMVFDTLGNFYIGDSNNNVIRKVDTSGIITTFAGNGVNGYGGDNGLATSAQLSGPEGMAFDTFGNLYIADTYNQRIRKVNSAGIITTVAGSGVQGYGGDNGLATAAKLYDPTRVAVDANGNLYIADLFNNRIRVVTGVTGINKLENKNIRLSVFPNPSSEKISVAMNGMQNYSNAIITIQNTLGQTVKKLSFAESVDISELSQGCYFIQVSLPEKEIYQAKFIKQ